MSDELILKDIAKILAKHGVYDVEGEILAKVKQHYEQENQCPECGGEGRTALLGRCWNCKGTGKIQVKEQKRLDRPELREKIDGIISDFGAEVHVQSPDNYPRLREGATAEILALIEPLIEELERGIKKQAMDTIKGIEEMYEGDEANAIEEAKKQGIEEGWQQAEAHYHIDTG